MVLGMLGEGGMGSVHLARQSLERDVAVKTVLARRRARRGQALLREAVLMGSLGTPTSSPSTRSASAPTGTPCW